MKVFIISLVSWPVNPRFHYLDFFWEILFLIKFVTVRLSIQMVWVVVYDWVVEVCNKLAKRIVRYEKLQLFCFPWRIQQQTGEFYIRQEWIHWWEYCLGWDKWGCRVESILNFWFWVKTNTPHPSQCSKSCWRRNILLCCTEV